MTHADTRSENDHGTNGLSGSNSLWAAVSCHKRRDTRNLLRAVEGLDTAYLTRWADRLGLAALYQEVSA